MELFLCLVQEHAIAAYVRVEVQQACVFLTSTPNRGKWSTDTPAALPWYPLNRRLVGPQSMFGCCEEEKSLSSPCQELNEVSFILFFCKSWLDDRSVGPNYLYCIVVGSRRLMPPDALQLKAYCTNLGF